MERKIWTRDEVMTKVKECLVSPSAAPIPAPNIAAKRTRGRPAGTKEDTFVYSLPIPPALKKSLDMYLDRYAGRRETIRSIIIAGLQAELAVISRGGISRKNYLDVEVRREDYAYLLKIPKDLNAELDQHLSTVLSGVPKRNVLVHGLQREIESRLKIKAPK